jgi:cation:H+ antiporter
VSVEAALLRREIPLLLAVSVIFVLLGLDGRLGRGEGLVLTALFGFFMWLTLRDARRGRVSASVASVETDPSLVPWFDLPPPRARWAALTVFMGMVVAGIGGLTAGGNLIVQSGLALAQRFGVSEALVGLSLVAVGTSLPELATTVIASARSESDIALGNIIGSNLFNILAVAGPVAAISPLRVASDVRAPQLVTMLVFTLLLGIMARERSILGRGHGVVLLVLYAVAMVWWTRLGS